MQVSQGALKPRATAHQHGSTKVSGLPTNGWSSKSCRLTPSFHGQLNGSSPLCPQGEGLIRQSVNDGNGGCTPPPKTKINEASGVSALDVESSKASGLFPMGSLHPGLQDGCAGIRRQPFPHLTDTRLCCSRLQALPEQFSTRKQPVPH